MAPRGYAGTRVAGSARTRRSGVCARARHGAATQWQARHLGGVPAWEARDRGGFVVTSSPLLGVVVSEPLASGSGRDSVSGWFVQIANLDTRPHVASAEAVYLVTQ